MECRQRIGVSAAGSKVLRVRKDGTGDVETVANTARTPLDVMVVGNSVDRTDTSGVWITTVACASLPCGNSQFDDFDPGTNGYGLLHVPISKTQYKIYSSMASAKMRAMAEGSTLTLKPYTTSSTPEGALPGNVRLLRSDDFLWVCFTALREGQVDSDAFAGVRVDVDNSRDALAQASDIGFFVSENGSVLTRFGDGAGDFDAAVAEGLPGRRNRRRSDVERRIAHRPGLLSFSA